MGPRRPISAAELDGRTVAREIRREVPGVLAWYGRATQAWWALVPGGGLARARLVEAINPEELREAIRNARGWPWPR
jgi:hypothetical protein